MSFFDNAASSSSQNITSNDAKSNVVTEEKGAKVKSNRMSYGHISSSDMKTEAVSVSTTGESLLIQRDSDNCDTINSFDLSFAIPSIAKWDRLNVCYYSSIDGKVISSQCIWLNKKVRDNIMSSSSVKNATLDVLGSREVAQGKKLTSAAFTRVPVAIADPKSAVVYGCNIFVAIE